MRTKIFICLILTAALTPILTFADHLGVVNKDDGTLSLVNVQTGKTDFIVDVGYFPHEVTSSDTSPTIIVTNYGKDHVRSTSPKNRPGNTLSFIDLSQSFTAQHIELGAVPCAPHGVVLSKNGERAYVTCEDRKEIAAVSLKEKQILYTVPTGQEQSHMLVVSPDESRAYTANFSSGTISVLNLKEKTVVKHITTGPGTEGIDLSPNGHFLYTTSVLSNRLIKIDTETLKIVGVADTDRSPIRVLATPDGQRLLVNNSAEGSLQIFSSDTLALIKRIKVGRRPIGITVPSNDFAFVANMLDDTVSIVDLNKLIVSRELSTGKKPDGITYIPSL